MDKYVVVRRQTEKGIQEELNCHASHYEPVGPVVFMVDVNGKEAYLATLKLKEAAN